jgi:ABC-2 type transport system ATP-binding protein
MMVRLAFAVMVEADADIMLIDEVLAVGDAAFAQKCVDVFRELRDAGRTIVLVTHDMATVQRFCHRALLIHDSEIQYIGDPEETALRYYRLNFGGEAAEVRAEGPLPDVHARVVDAWLENESGERIQNVEQNSRLYLNCLFETRQDLNHPVFSFQFMNADGAEIFGFTKALERDGGPDRLEAGQRVRISGEIENRLLPGRYYVSSWIVRNRSSGDLALHSVRLLEFVVYGTERGPGSVRLNNDVQAVIESEGT